MSPTDMAECPGCGDFGDAKHIAACVVLKRDELIARGWRHGAEFVLQAVKTQLGRRGSLGVDVDALVKSIEATAAPRHHRWR